MAGIESSTRRPRLRVTFVLNGRSLHGGVYVVVLYGNRLIERGHDVSIAILRRAMGRRPDRVAAGLYESFRSWSGLARDHVHDFRGRVLSIRPEDLQRQAPDGDAIVATHWSTADWVAACPAPKGRKYYFLQHYEAHTFDPCKVDATWRLPMRKIVIAKWLDDLARDRFDDSAAVLVPNGVDTELFDADPRGLHTPRTVGVMYSSDVWKRTDLAFEALRLARRKLPDLGLVTFSATKPMTDVPLPTNTRFHLRPKRETIRDIYASADVWLCSSDTEGFALPPLEAMACRCPVVVTRCGGPEDFVEHGVNGYLVDVNDAQAMADGIVEVLQNESAWRRMSDAAYETRRRFNWERSVDAFEDALYDRAPIAPDVKYTKAGEVLS